MESDLSEIHSRLMDAYREALRKCDELSPIFIVDKALIHHAVAFGSRSAASYIKTRFSETVGLYEETLKFSNELYRNDSLSGFQNYALVQLRHTLGAILAFVVGGGVLSILAILIKSVLGVMAGFGNLMALAWILYYGLEKGLPVFFNALRGPVFAREILANTIRSPEKELWSLTGSRPPIRYSMYVAGVFQGLAVAAAGYMALFVLSKIF